MGGYWEGQTIRILILGGTRFTGRSTVELLVSLGHQVTVISRRSSTPAGVFSSVITERLDGLKQLNNQAYDVTVDFICSGAQDVDALYQYVDPGLYILISTIWLEKMEGDQEVFQRLPEITKRYLNAKWSAEEAVTNKRMQGHQATSLRLPIQSGMNDHTKRLLFYIDRIADEAGLLLVDGGVNQFQIVNNEDVALALAEAISMDILGSAGVWDAMPDRSISLREMVSILATGKSVSLCDIGSELLEKLFPEYLLQEPFWREYSLRGTDNNLFQATGVEPRRLEEWGAALWSLSGSLQDSPLRRKEISIIQNIKERSSK